VARRAPLGWEVIDTMLIRRNTLAEALDELEARRLSGVATIVVSRPWWEALAAKERDAFRRRAADVGVALRADDAMSGHFVELRGDDEATPPLSSEHPT
jgi:hypothetical protein